MLLQTTLLLSIIKDKADFVLEKEQYRILSRTGCTKYRDNVEEALQSYC